MGACKELYEFTVVQSGKDILFDIADVDTKNKQFMLYDISVAQKGCKDSACITWELVRLADKTDVTTGNVVRLPIKYGQKFVNMEVRQFVNPISTGEYEIGATFAIIKEEKIVGSKLVSGSFEIKAENKVLILAK